VAAGRAQYRGLETAWFETFCHREVLICWKDKTKVLFGDDRTRLFCRWRATTENRM
jgi:hypothetical protein